jgi:hypothetical protein
VAANPGVTRKSPDCVSGAAGTSLSLMRHTKAVGFSDEGLKARTRLTPGRDGLAATVLDSAFSRTPKHRYILGGIVMSDYKVESLNGLLTKAGTCYDFLEVVIPLARRLLAEFSALPPRLFFLTQDGEDGLLTFEREAIDRLGKDDLAYKLRRFCALHCVKACAFLSTATLREPPVGDDEGSDGRADENGRHSAGESNGQKSDRPATGEPLLPVGTFVGWLMGEFLGEAARVCVWRIDPSTGPAPVARAWNVEATLEFGRFVNLLGQGKELGYPVSDELRDRIVAHQHDRLDRQRHPGTILSVEKGKTAGEIALETDEGPARCRVVEKDGIVYWVGLYTGKPMCKADKARLLAELRSQTGEPNVPR